MQDAHPHIPGFLGVTRSATGRTWVGPNAQNDRESEALSQSTHLPRPLCRVLANRGVEKNQVQQFLAPKLRDLLPDPSSLRDMDKATSRLIKAVQTQERIAIFADYDVDGATSAALLITWLKAFNIAATLYIPDRIDEGYGPNVEAMSQLAQTHSLIICVDCGTLSHEPIAAAQDADVIVLDHHLGGETLPPAHAIVNPNRQDETGDYAYLCAAGVVFLQLVSANRTLKTLGTPAPDLISLLDLVALGTVADVAPLIGVNRAFVRQGLQVMAKRQRLGLRVLSDISRIDTAPTSYHLGFILGPRINAGGRIGKADLGARLLICEDEQEALSLSQRLDELNTGRKDVESMVRDQAMTQLEERGGAQALAWAADDGWHPGVVGIVASRVKEKMNRPAVIIGFEGDAGKGSGRSVTGVDLGASIQQLAHEGMIEKGGGHKMAAGLSLTRAQLNPAMDRLNQLLTKQGADQIGVADLRISSVLMPAAATLELIEQLEAAGPYGAGASAPRFAFPDCIIHFAKPVGQNHLKITFGDGHKSRLNGICFGAMDTEIGPLLMASSGQPVHLAGRLDVNTWQGRRSVQLIIEDAVPAAS